MWFLQVFLDHLCSLGAEKSWMPTLERSGHLKYASWHLQLFWFLTDEVSFQKKQSLWIFMLIKNPRYFVVYCIIVKGQ